MAPEVCAYDAKSPPKMSRRGKVKGKAKRAQKPQKSLVCVLGGFPERLLESLSATWLLVGGYHTNGFSTPTPKEAKITSKSPQGSPPVVPARPVYSEPLSLSLRLAD